jgi:hypothetical protein
MDWTLIRHVHVNWKTSWKAAACKFARKWVILKPVFENVLWKYQQG